MNGGSARAPGKRWWQWGLGSLALHAGLVTFAHAPRVEGANNAPEQPLWLETLPAPEPEPEPEPKPEPEPEPKPKPEPRPSRRPGPPKLRLSETAPTTDGLAIPGTTDGTGQALQATVDAAISGDGNDNSKVEKPPALPEAPPQFSLWLRPLDLQQLVIVRAPSALLNALPGYRDILRGSEVLPFDKLERMRVFLPGLDAQRLVLAGVHRDGEAEVVRAAERIAATRERMPGWRSSGELRATSWVDGSGYDRGLAVHGAAFVIGGRTQLPILLGETAPTKRVDGLSRAGGDVIAAAVIQHVARYLPMLADCHVHSLRLSVTRAFRLSVRAELATEAQVAQNQACAAKVGNAAPQLRYIAELLGRAAIQPGKPQLRLDTEVTSEDISTILDELGWALRRVTRD